MKKLAVFASGNGSNAENICNYFSHSSEINVVFIGTNNEKALVTNRAKNLNIPIVHITKKELTRFIKLNKILQEYGVDYIILAGFLLKIPSQMVFSYSKKIINIHPSLLPKYGGKGMYGKNIYDAVVKNKESESGITIHFVNQNYDEGEIVLQKKILLSSEETSQSLEKKIRYLEFEYFPKTIEKIILK